MDYDPLDAVLDPVAAAADAVHDRSFSYGDVDGAMAEAELVLRQTFHFPRFTCTPVECYAVVADWDATAGRLTAWANFQGPFTLHGVAAAALGLKGDRLRLLTPPDSGGSFGIKSSVFAYVVLMGLAARHLGVPVTWTEDRLEHLAASAAATGRTTEVEAGFTADGQLSRSATTRSRTSARTSARPSRRRSIACTARSRAPTPSRTSPSGTASCSRTRSPRASTAASAGRSSTSGSSGRWRSPPRRLGLDPAELARRNLIPAAAMPYRTPSGALYDSGDYEACLDHALELADYDALGRGSPRCGPKVASRGSGSRASSSPRSRTWGTSRSPRPPTSAR